MVRSHQIDAGQINDSSDANVCFAIANGTVHVKYWYLLKEQSDREYKLDIYLVRKK